jgi:competence protein ComEC
LMYLAGVALTTFIASMATSPYVLFNFNRLDVFGLLANLIAVTVTAFWVMPLEIVAFFLMLFGIERIALSAKGELVLVTAHFAAALPGAARVLPPFSQT